MSSPSPSSAPASSAPPGNLPAEIQQLLAELKSLLDHLPPGSDPLAALKKTGAWPEKPIVATAASGPIYVRTPVTLQFGNVPAAALPSQLTAQTPLAAHPGPHGEAWSQLNIQSPPKVANA